MRQFDPKEPRRRYIKVFIGDGEDAEEMTVFAVKVGVIDEILGELIRIFEFDKDKPIRQQLEESYVNYPAEFIRAASKLTEFPEEDIRGWDVSLLVEVILSYINGQYEMVKTIWLKKKGVMAGLLSEQTTDQLPESGLSSGNS